MSQKRLISLCSALVAMFALVLCRVFWVATDSGYAVSAGAQTEYDAALPAKRGDFYDCSGRKLTGYTPKWYALCIPGDSSYAKLFPYVSYRDQTALYEKRNSMTPFMVEVGQDLTDAGIYSYAGAQRYLPLPIAVHLLGYLDGEGHGVAGLEKAYDDVLYKAGDEQVVQCTTTAQGALLTGTAPTVQAGESGTGLGVQLTLDADVQRACEGLAQQQMPRGAIVVMECASGDIVASVSMPEFDPDNVARSIAANDTSLINRPLAAFSAGSVFKVVLAVAAYQAGLDWYSCECTGSVTVVDQTYRCALGRAHGEVNLRAALEQSCNSYFVELGQLLGGERILQTAQSMGFGSAAAVAPGLKSSAGTLPEQQTLENIGQLAMFAFGQGKLTVTPLQITAMTNTVADGGVYRAPVFIKDVVREIDMTATETGADPEEKRVFSTDLARVLRSMLVSVVEDGIGSEAEPEQGGAGGKTGTAQTGQYREDGEELLNYWFTGFYPAENPQYTITVLQDGVLEPAVSSAEIFAQVANALFVCKNS